MNTQEPNSTSTILKGGEFLIKDIAATDIFTPEEWQEEQRMIADMCRDLLKKKFVLTWMPLTGRKKD